MSSVLVIFDKRHFLPMGAMCNSYGQLSVKAAAMRGMLYWLETILQEDDFTDTRHGQMRYLLISTLVSWDVLCRQHGRFFSAPAKEEIAALTERALMCPHIEIQMDGNSTWFEKFGKHRFELDCHGCWKGLQKFWVGGWEGGREAMSFLLISILSFLTR